jgi:trk system potassium uptake protein TrkH
LAETSVRKIKVIILLAIAVNLLSFMVLLYSEYYFNTGLSFRNLLFEVVSALGTVGLSTGITAKLSAFGKCVIIADMFIGRVGPLAIVTALLFTGDKTVKIDYPEEKILVG